MSDDLQNRRQRPSIYDVAERAGVSHMTVSRVLNGHPNIKESTRDRVNRAIDDMNYTRSSIARALATSKTMRIGVLVDAPVQFGPNSTLRAIEHAARGAGYAVTTYSVDGMDVDIDAGIVELVTQGVDALCVIAPRSSSLEVLRRNPAGLPTVIIATDPGADLLTVSVDQRLGATAAMDHLLGLGHRSILHVAGPLDWLDARARERAWHDSLKGAGLAVPPLIVGDWTSEFGYHVGAHHDAVEGATAIFAANDQMALGLVHGLTTRGLSVPHDISIVGFDDLPDARHFLPPLTTVRQHFSSLGTASINSLIHAIEGRPDAEPLRIAPELIIRESTALPRS